MSTNVDKWATGSDRVALVTDIMNKNGIKADAEDLASWLYIKNGGVSFFFWSPIDVSQLANPKGYYVPFIRFNCDTGTYTIWNCKVSTTTTTILVGGTGKSVTYNKVETTGFHINYANSDNSKQTYANAAETMEKVVALYNKDPAKYQTYVKNDNGKEILKLVGVEL